MGNKRTRRYKKRTRRTRKYGGTSSRISDTSRHYIGNPDETSILDDDIEEPSSISSILDNSSNADTSVDFGEPKSRMRNDPCYGCYDTIRHILYKTTLPNKIQSRYASIYELNKRIIKRLKGIIPPYPMA